MMRFTFLMAAFVLGCSVACGQSATICDGDSCVTVNADGATGAYEYAARLNGSRLFRHDPGFRGAEVIFKSSGAATPEQAHEAWMRSPGHRRLLAAGAIQEVKCVGSVCVGRGIEATQNAVQQTKVSVRTRLKRFSGFLRCR